MARRIHKIEKLGGVCLADGTSKENSLCYVKNMISVGGITRKRNGWRVLYDFKDGNYSPLPINGIYEYKGDNKSCLIVHAGKQLYECDYSFTNITAIDMGELRLENRRSTAQMFENELWIAGADRAVIYNGEKIYCPTEHPLAYVPITRVGITAQNRGEAFEGRNLLTRKRINTLRGRKGSVDGQSFILDSPVAYGRSFKLTATVRVKKSEDLDNDYTTEYVGIDSQGQEINTLVLITVETSCLTKGVLLTGATVTDAKGDTVRIDSPLGVRVEGQELYVDFDCTAYEADKDNIEVEFYAQGTGITSIDKAQLFAVNTSKSGESNLLAFYKNRMYYSYGEEKPFYFPCESIVYVGQEREGVVSALPMTDGYLGVYKENSFFRLKRGAEKGSGWEVFPSADSIGSINSLCAVRLDYDCISFDESGIFGVRDLDNPEYMTSRLCNRAKSIQPELNLYSKDEKGKACACVNNGMYYLFINGRVYITGQEHKSGKGSDFGYEWWIFDSCPCSYATSVNGELLMGRENGEIAIFDSEYKDRKSYTLTENEWDFAFYDNLPFTTAVFNSQIKVKSGDRISLSPHFIHSCNAQYVAKDKMIYVPSNVFFDGEGKTLLYKGEEILLIDKDGYTVYEGEIKETHPDSLGISVDSLGIYSDTFLDMYLKKNEGQEYHLEKSGSVFTLNLNGTPVRLLDTEVNRVYIRTERNVECELCTSAIDLDEDKRGNLCAIVLTPSKDTSCRVKIGYETRKNAFSREVNIFSHIDFNRVDFGNMGFDSGFEKSIRINCLERNFDRIKIRISSQDGECLGIESISLYTN